MFSSKAFYLIAGFDIGFAIVSAMGHDPLAFLLAGIAGLMIYIGDKRYSEEKGDQNG
jgi:zinc transporter ZupT